MSNLTSGNLWSFPTTAEFFKNETSECSLLPLVFLIFLVDTILQLHVNTVKQFSGRIMDDVAHPLHSDLIFAKSSRPCAAASDLCLVTHRLFELLYCHSWRAILRVKPRLGLST
nr:unnamed protein product [Spirometra erinaceieuropaei]